MGRKLLLLFFLVSISVQGQNFEPDRLFSKVIGDHIRSYKAKANLAIIDKDYERAEFLFDSLIKNVVNGSYLDNFEVRKLSGRTIELKDFEKPIFLMTYASWCAPGVGEIPALNEIAKTYAKDIDVVVLFWDSKKKVRKASREYANNITILYVDESENKHDHIIEKMKHSLGFPTCFFMDQNKRIIDVRRGVLHHSDESYETSYNLNHSAFASGVSLLRSVGKNLANTIVSKE